MHFHAAPGDKALQHTFATGADGRGTRKITYTTPRIQNEISDNLAEHLQGKIAKSIQAARFFFFFIQADEGTDSSLKEQLPLVLRYVDLSTKEACEDFIAFSECDQGTTDRALADLITYSEVGNYSCAMSVVPVAVAQEKLCTPPLVSRTRFWIFLRNICRARSPRAFKQLGFFFIQADEGTGSSLKEQLPLVLRYLGPSTKEACEDFVAFLECGRALADLITYSKVRNYSRTMFVDSAAMVQPTQPSTTSVRAIIKEKQT